MDKNNTLASNGIHIILRMNETLERDQFSLHPLSFILSLVSR